MPPRALLPVFGMLLLLWSVAPASAKGHPHARRAVHATDIVAGPRTAMLVLWRDAGHGKCSLATTHRHGAGPVSGCRFARVHRPEDGGQWGDDRYDAALPRAPAVAAVMPVALVRIAVSLAAGPLSQRPSSGRAPPLA